MPDVPPPKEPLQFTKPKLLIGEGYEEVSVFRALLKHLSIDDIQVEQYGGKNNLGKSLKAFTRVSGFRNIVTIGITRDADVDASNAYSSVRGFLSSASLASPEAHGKFAGEHPKCGVFLMPDGKSPGMLEDLCLEAVRNDPALECVKAFLECVSAKANRNPDNPAKAKIHAWLASQRKPDYRLGEAAQAGLIPWDNPAFDSLKEFIQAL